MYNKYENLWLMGDRKVRLTRTRRSALEEDVRGGKCSRVVLRILLRTWTISKEVTSENTKGETQLGFYRNTSIHKGILVD